MAVPMIHGELLDSNTRLLLEAAEQGRWSQVVRYLRHCDHCFPRRQWVIEEIAKHGSFGDVDKIIHDGYVDDCVEAMIPHLLSRRMWLLLHFILSKNPTLEGTSSVVLEASKHADDDSFYVHIINHCSSTDCSEVFTHLVSRGMWRSAGCALDRSMPDPQRTWAIEEASKRSEDKDFAKYILPRCSEEDLNPALHHLVSRGLWLSAGKALAQITHPTQRRWIIQEAIRRADDDDFVNHIVASSSGQTEKEEVLIHLVSRNLWGHVGSPLRQVSKACHEWAVKKASKLANEQDFVDRILCLCSDEELEMVAIDMASRALWKPFDSCAQNDRSIKEHVLECLLGRQQWSAIGQFLTRDIDFQTCRNVTEEAIRHGLDLFGFLPFHYLDMLPIAVEHKQWRWTNALLNDVVFDALYQWLKVEGSCFKTQLWKLIHSCHVPVYQALEVSKRAFRPRVGLNGLWEMYQCFENLTSLSKTLSEPLITSLLRVLCCTICSEDTDVECSTESAKQSISNIYSCVTCCIEENRNNIPNPPQILYNVIHWTEIFTTFADSLKNVSSMFLLHFFQGLHMFYSSRQGQGDDATLLKMLAVFPLFPQLQSEALRLMVRQQRWEVLSQACLSHVWEHDRRQLFKAAVEQRQWGVVRQWADHSLHDDQRHWAMKEAFQEKQWGVYLLLADFGLTVHEQMHAHYMVAKHADWDTVLAMMARGGDVAEVRWLLDNFAKGRLRKTPRGDVSVFEQRCQRLEEEEDSMRDKCHQDGLQALERSQWRTVLFHILHGPSHSYFAAVTDKAIQDQAWHVLMHVVRLGMNREERDALFPTMVRQQQWAVGRALLERGVDVRLCLEALPELLERNQWTLVARVMEYSVDDAVRCQVMQCAFQRREGVLFWHCLTTMEKQEQMSVETRVRLFHQAISRDVWQALKPLVEEKDEPGIQCRDLAFLEGIEQHLWDVVDHCQVQGANINVRDEEGEIPVHREARRREWAAVEEMVYRGADPNLLDKEGVSVLHRLIEHRQWDTVKFVLQYGADIHLVAKTVASLRQLLPKNQTFCSPLELLINDRRLDIIHFSLMWCPNQGKGVNHQGRTTLHTACASGRWDMLQDLVCRKADPLALTSSGRSALAYAVLNDHCPQLLVAQCAALGFSSHQPALTHPRYRVVDEIIYETAVWRVMERDEHLATSPLLLSLMQNSASVSRMLYDSGACSNAEVFQLHSQLPDLFSLSTDQGQRLYKAFHQRMIRHEDEGYMEKYYRIVNSLWKALPLLRELATQPRSLKSSCRLLVCRSLDVRGKRHRDIQRLPLTQDLRDYLLFHDLTTCCSLT